MSSAFRIGDIVTFGSVNFELNDNTMSSPHRIADSREDTIKMTDDRRKSGWGDCTYETETEVLLVGGPIPPPYLSSEGPPPATWRMEWAAFIKELAEVRGAYALQARSETGLVQTWTVDSPSACHRASMQAEVRLIYKVRLVEAVHAAIMAGAGQTQDD